MPTGKPSRKKKRALYEVTRESIEAGVTLGKAARRRAAKQRLAEQRQREQEGERE